MQQSNHPPTCGESKASLICGVCVFLLGPIAGIPAVITGHIARNKIRNSGGAITGAGMAMTGLIFGYVSIVLTMVLIIAHLIILLIGAVWINSVIETPEKKVDFLPPTNITNQNSEFGLNPQMDEHINQGIESIGHWI